MFALVGISCCRHMQHTVAHRQIHRLPSYEYLRIWKEQGINYKKEMHHPFSLTPSDALSPGENMLRSPQLVTRILSVEAAMYERGMIPFVHAVPAGHKVIRAISDRIRGIEKDQFFTSLRAAAPPKQGLILEPKEGERQSSLLSLSYALTSGITPLESAGSWGFINHFGCRQNFELREIFTRLMESINLQTSPEQMEYSTKRAWKLIRQYGRLKVGDFLIIGIPENKLSQFAYDAKPYNIPSNKDIRSVAFEPQRHTDSLLQQGTHMAALLLCEEVLDPQTGFVIVDASDEKQVEDFCKNSACKSEHASCELIEQETSSFEKEHSDIRKHLDQELESFISDFAQLHINPKKQIDIPLFFDEDVDSKDFPPQEI